MSQESVLVTDADDAGAREWSGARADGHEHADGAEIDEEHADEAADAEEDMTVKLKASPPMIDTTLGGPSPTMATGSPQQSLRSLPAINEPASAATPPAAASRPTTPSVVSTSAASVRSTTRSQTAPPAPPSPSRRHLHSQSSPTLDQPVMRSPNRISGFFSNLIHRQAPPPSPLGPAPADRAGTPAGGGAGEDEPPSRSSSPAVPPRPATPPPSLPAPSLQELGLALSVLTPDLAPSHFSTPPASGAFLAPHYLLLCHAQGLDVLPLVSPPAPQPYALIRRVPFKSVVVMEHRGVLVAIAGRRDGVRVYALDEVKKAVEWRLDVEVRRERERARREETKRGGAPVRDSVDRRPDSAGGAAAAGASASRVRRASSMIVPHRAPQKKTKAHSAASSTSGASVPAPPLPAPPRTPFRPPQPAAADAPPMLPPMPFMEAPPSYRPPSPAYRPPSPTERLRPQLSAVSLRAAARRSSVTNVLGGVVGRAPLPELARTTSEKAEWLDASDEEEAIGLMTAGPSGGQALDERTSAIAAASASPTLPAAALGSPRPVVSALSTPPAPTTNGDNGNSLTPTQSRRRPPELHLDDARHAPVPGRPAPPSPTPTLLTLQQALLASPLPARGPLTRPLDNDVSDGDDDDGPGARTPTNDRLTFAEMLMESRVPDLPPPGTRVPQQALMLTHSSTLASGNDDDSSAPGSPTASAHTSHTMRSRTSQDTTRSAGAADRSGRRRRRWSVLDGIFASGPGGAGAAQQTTSPTSMHAPPLPAPPAPGDALGLRRVTTPGTPGAPPRLQRSASATRRPASARSASSALVRPATAGGSMSTVASAESGTETIPPVPATPSRFLSRLLGFNARRSEESAGESTEVTAGAGKSERKASGSVAQQTPAPKLEYVKLPGTKGALLIKAVETNKKSFLAILCGDNGEKVELFAGTYRTALGLSRTFILPDSPRSLELQLQGDDLVEVFLVFAQNVFGLEPATVRVREVRIGRAERRAARRRARELRDAGAPAAVGEDGAPPDDATSAPLEETGSTTVSVSVGFVGDAPTAPATPSVPTTPTGPTPPTGTTAAATATAAAPLPAAQDEILTVAAAQMGPYTTFQQLPFSPNFPLAAIADEYVIPPTYPDFLEYRSAHEPEDGGAGAGGDADAGSEAGEGEASVDPAGAQFSPPGLPLPTPSGPSNWFYRDPKGNVHGPWNAGQMHTWFREGLLPLDLPVRRESDAEYTPLRELRQQCIDPMHPFRHAAPPRAADAPGGAAPLPLDPSKPLLAPLSLLTQSRIFGPPALFYSTRGGHSTVIVDGRGRSVLKGRFTWSRDAPPPPAPAPPPADGRLGDVKRLEAFDVDAARSVLVALRQGGFEAVDFADALLRPADASRALLPQFAATPSQVNRRAPFTWKIGMPVGTATSSATRLAPLRGPSRLLHAPAKKMSTGPPKAGGKAGEFGGQAPADGESEHTRDEVVFLGRREDSVYICERNGGAFRILRLAPARAL